MKTLSTTWAETGLIDLDDIEWDMLTELQQLKMCEYLNEKYGIDYEPIRDRDMEEPETT